MKIQDLRSFLAKALVKISCKTQSAQHNKQTKCEYIKGDLRYLFGPLTVSNLLASVQVQFAYKDHFWFAHKGLTGVTLLPPTCLYEHIHHK